MDTTTVARLEADELVPVIFGEYGPDPEESDHKMTAVYPEVLLQQTDSANKYYGSFQRYTHQFINVADTGKNSIVRWNDSSIESAQRLIIGSWAGTDVKEAANETTSGRKGPKKTRSRANALFAWSSGDAYIKARKRELQIQRGEIDPVSEVSEEVAESPRPDSKPVLAKQHSIAIKFPQESITNKLNRVVEHESNQFIHARIQVIRGHHRDEINKQIHERKRRDHEIQLRKLKLKEEEYEKELNKTLEPNKNAGFFNTLFGIHGEEESKKNKSKRFSFLPKKKDEEIQKEEIWNSEKEIERENQKQDQKENGEEDEKEERKINQERDSNFKNTNHKASQTTSSKNTNNLKLNLSESNWPESMRATSTPTPHDEDFDDFEDFASSGPISKSSTPVSAHPSVKPVTSSTPVAHSSSPPAHSSAVHSHIKTSHRFIPVEHTNIHADLLDIFGSTTPTTPTAPLTPQKMPVVPLKPAKPTKPQTPTTSVPKSEPENLLEF